MRILPGMEPTRPLIRDHIARPGPFYWSWRCLICSEPVADHAGLLDRIDGRLRRLTRDPDRWADSDLTRDEWLLLARHNALLAIAATVGVIVLVLWWTR